MNSRNSPNRNHALSRKREHSALSLVEVVLALGIVAFSILTIVGLLGGFAKVSSATAGREEAAAAALNSIQLCLEGKAPDSANSAPISFTTVYDWVRTARTSPAMAKILYAYRDSPNPDGYLVSQTPPTGQFNGKIMAALILAPDLTILPDSQLVNTASAYNKSYLPLRIEIHALSSPSESLSATNLVDTYPSVISL
jgi:hypothetical protein